MSILMSILSNDGYIILNKYVMKALGLHEAILLGELCSEYIYWYKEEKLQDGFFYSTRENIEKETTLSPFQQRQALKKLTEIGLVEILERDMPKKTYYKVNEEKVYKFLLETDLNFTDVKKFDDKTLNNLTSSDEKITHQEVKKLEINNNNINNNKNNNNILSNLITEETEQKDEMRYDEIFKQNIEYDILVQDIKNKELIKNITDIAVETLNTSKKEIYINSEPKAIEVVRSQLLKLNPMHIQYIINCLQQNTKDVKSIKSYILTSLYNAVNTMEIDTTLQVAKIMNN
ncbi:MAG: DUF6017 domain-containing protein [Clostridia bacterium]|nr:DUF6017 domain-containing protein [Clostridia bacterium]